MANSSFLRGIMLQRGGLRMYPRIPEPQQADRQTNRDSLWHGDALAQKLLVWPIKSLSNAPALGHTVLLGISWSWHPAVQGWQIRRKQFQVIFVGRHVFTDTNKTVNISLLKKVRRWYSGIFLARKICHWPSHKIFLFFKQWSDIPIYL